MICNIYRSDTKSGLYIYLAKGKAISDLPEELVKKLGKYTEVMELDLDKRSQLANEDINVVKANLKEMGYHLQIPNDIVKNVIDYKK
ncbi:MAG: YcgL domain-containing protein [Proteobacteria bacterium]|nr:YcgL domain-containing protein [Pseudomonadota bacterium]